MTNDRIPSDPSRPGRLAELRAFSRRRRMIAGTGAVAAFAVIVAASGLAAPLLDRMPAAGPAPADGLVAAWLSIAAVAFGSALAGLVVASYVDAPIGADATLCDTRWPVLGLVALHLATDLRSAEPLLTGAVRPVVALAAVALLAWALRERLASERRATAPVSGASAEADGEVCTTCRPLFRRSAPHEPDHDHDHHPGEPPILPSAPTTSPERRP